MDAKKNMDIAIGDPYIDESLDLNTLWTTISDIHPIF